MTARTRTVYPHKLDRRHVWAMNLFEGRRTGLVRIAHCVVCHRCQRVYDMAQFQRLFGEAWLKVPRALYFGNFLKPAPADTSTVPGGDRVTFTRTRTLAMPPD